MSSRPSHAEHLYAFDYCITAVFVFVYFTLSISACPVIRNSAHCTTQLQWNRISSMPNSKVEMLHRLQLVYIVIHKLNADLCQL